jgi:hypothetical protein
MPYSYEKLENLPSGNLVYEGCSCCADPLDQFEIKDEQGDRITTVYDESEAEALVSHLNR